MKNTAGANYPIASIGWWSSQWGHWSHAFWEIFHCWACGFH